MLSPDEITRQQLPELLTKLRRYFSWGVMWRMVEEAGFRLSTEADNLRKFAGGMPGYNAGDQQRLEQFFATETGKLIATLADPAKLPSGLADFFRKGSKHPDGHAIEGWFYGFHGSYLKENHFVVRAIRIERDPIGLLAVRNDLQDSQTLGRGLRCASGYLSFVDGNPHILCCHKDNARGAVLFIGEQLEPADGPAIDRITGQMLGTTRKAYFSRAMLMLRAPKGITEKDFIAETGIFPFGDLPPAFQAHFRLLKEQQPTQIFPNPILSLP